MRFIALLALFASALALQPSLDRRTLLKSIPAAGSLITAAPAFAGEFDKNGQRKADFGCGPKDDYFCKGGKLRNNVANAESGLLVKGEVEISKYRSVMKDLQNNGGVKTIDTVPKTKSS